MLELLTLALVLGLAAWGGLRMLANDEPSPPPASPYSPASVETRLAPYQVPSKYTPTFAPDDFNPDEAHIERLSQAELEAMEALWDEGRIEAANEAMVEAAHASMAHVEALEDERRQALIEALLRRRIS